MEIERLNKCDLCQSDRIAVIDRKANICQCRDCKYIFVNPRPSFDEIANFYSKTEQYDSWIADEKARDKLWQRRLHLVKREKKSGNLLDVGTGTGQFLRWARKDFNVTGTEISQTAVKIAKEKYNIDVIQGEIEDIDFGDTKFDIITLFHVLEHVPHPSSTIERCKELLSEDGVLIIAVPNDIFSIRSFIKKILVVLRVGRFRNYGKLGLPKITLDKAGDEIHLSYFIVSTLEKFLKKAGFKIVRNTLDPYYAVESLRRVLFDLQYYCCLMIKLMFNINIYSTIWISAKVK